MNTLKRKREERLAKAANKEIQEAVVEIAEPVVEPEVVEPVVEPVVATSEAVVLTPTKRNKKAS